MVKLVDFGLAEVLGTHSFAGGAGTYAYMAPEDFHPEERSDRQSDIWAVGVILYETLAGRRPFQVTKSKDPFAWKQAVEHDPLLPLSEFRPDVPPALEAIVFRALARDKAARYKDAGDMAADLRGLAVGREAPPAPNNGGARVNALVGALLAIPSTPAAPAPNSASSPTLAPPLLGPGGPPSPASPPPCPTMTPSSLSPPTTGRPPATS